ncbi:UPF0183-domain-containing protein [Trichodelitschia bisporula]|uniref:UPF0183-domain-containing protein n=1 Tax=Trichodelitschia bisporula TaxID=703511 RepID=A0A6G1I3U7_9PEZI|nr:UPF0183-domain-containing protein [Trichodelitschia bisporula]
MADVPASVVEGRSLGIFALGASLHHTLSFIKAQPLLFPKIEMSYSQSEPLSVPPMINLPANGIRLRFDATEQRLRLIEVTKFGKSPLVYKDQDIVSPSSTTGPTFKHVYQLFGPTTPGEYLPAQSGKEGEYSLSYPGISFSFPIRPGASFARADWASQVSVLSSSACGPARAMAIFHGESWPAARKVLYTSEMPFPRAPLPPGIRDGAPREIEAVHIHGECLVELQRKDAPSFWLTIGETTAQDLLAELGPPDTTHPKKKPTGPARPAGSGSRRPSAAAHNRPLEVGKGESSEEEEEAEWEEEEEEGTVVLDVETDLGTFWNYYGHGLDVLVGPPTFSTPRGPKPFNPDSGLPNMESLGAVADARNHPTVSQIKLHGNVPGSYQFQRHRRLRWTMEDVPAPDGEGAVDLDSEMKFAEIQRYLRGVYGGRYTSPEEERRLQLPMVLNRGWGESPSVSGSTELLGGWEDGGGKGRKGEEGKTFEVELYGFRGFVFEVLKTGDVSAVTIY